MRAKSLIAVFALSFVCCRADTPTDQANAELSKLKFSSDQQRLAFFQSESEKVESKIAPSQGTPRSVVERRFGPGQQATDLVGKPRGLNHIFDYALTSDASMEVSYANDKVQFATISYSGVPKQTVPNSAEEKESWLSQYISSQVLLKTFKPRN